MLPFALLHSSLSLSLPVWLVSPAASMCSLPSFSPYHRQVPAPLSSGSLCAHTLWNFTKHFFVYRVYPFYVSVCLFTIYVALSIYFLLFLLIFFALSVKSQTFFIRRWSFFLATREFFKPSSLHRVSYLTSFKKKILHVFMVHDRFTSGRAGSRNCGDLDQSYKNSKIMLFSCHFPGIRSGRKGAPPKWKLHFGSYETFFLGEKESVKNWLFKSKTN